MANIVYFEIPADDVDRAKRFYQSLLGWKIEPTKVSIPDMATMKYQDIITGEPNEAPMGSLSTGGMYKRQMNEPIINYVMVDDIDEKIAMVEKLVHRFLINSFLDCDSTRHFIHFFHFISPCK